MPPADTSQERSCPSLFEASGTGRPRAEGRAKQTAGKATGNDSLRRQGKAEELKSRLNQFARKIKDAISR
jgi:uncharacterized protein YjbJ (UPF0337 family)